MDPRKKKILIVDDEESFTRMVKWNLEANGDYEVLPVNEGGRALKMAQGFEPDLIFLDSVMPHVTGKELAIQIRNDPKLKNIPIVFLTALAVRENDGTLQGCPDHEQCLPKPIGLAELTACIKENLR